MTPDLGVTTWDDPRYGEMLTFYRMNYVEVDGITCRTSNGPAHIRTMIEVFDDVNERDADPYWGGASDAWRYRPGRAIDLDVWTSKGRLVFKPLQNQERA